MKKLFLVLAGLLVFLVLFSALITVLLKDGVSLKDKIGLVRVEGPIIDSKSTVEEIKTYTKNPAIKAIVIRVDSPGGAVAPSQEIFYEIRKAKSKKKIVASMGSIAASGGYYISSPADKIVANPGTITGSIGVIMEIPNIEGLMNKVGIKKKVIKSGKHKDIASVFRDMDEEERRMLQDVIDDVHGQFVRDVSESRNMPYEEVTKLADGRIFTGRQAIELGLVDELGGLEDAIKISAELAGIRGEPEVVSKEKKLSVIEMLRGRLSGNFSEVIPSFNIKYILSF